MLHNGKNQIYSNSTGLLIIRSFIDTLYFIIIIIIIIITPPNRHVVQLEGRNCLLSSLSSNNDFEKEPT
jgi:hypothetical protein